MKDGFVSFRVVRIFDLAAPSLGLAEPAAEEPSFIERVQRGEADALAVAYDLHYAPLCAFARRLLSDDAAAEDLVQDVFLTLPRVAWRLDAGRSLRSFLLGVTANRARHHHRSRRRFFLMRERLSREPDRTRESPEDHTERGALARILARALDRLSMDHRVAFVLCEVEGRSSREAAEILGVPEGTVRTRLFHARHKLRATLAKEGLP